MGPLQWGDVPTAVGALFAGGAAWFAFQTIKSQRQQIGEQQAFIREQMDLMGEQRQNLVLERQALLAEAQERRSAQARLIRIELSNQYLKVINNSSSPLTDVRCRIHGRPPRAAAALQDDGPVSSHLLAQQLHDVDQRDLPLLPAGLTGYFLYDPPGRFATVRFTDEAGVLWELDTETKLKEIPGSSDQ